MFRLADGRLAMTGSAAERIERLHEWFFEATEREARAGARLVAWPEMNFLVKAEDEPAALARAERLAAREGIFLSMGMGTVRAGAPKPFQNKTVLVDSRGSVAYSYLKSRPVMGWEDTVMQVGDGRLPIADTALGRVSSAICFEGDHADLARQAGRAGAELFLLPANDWREIKEIHLAMAAFRAVENGTPLLRPASGGVSAAFDAHGRLLGRTDHTTGPSTLVVEIPTGRVATLYARVGDLFAWLCVAGCALAPALAWRRAKARAAPAENVFYCATGSSA
jgi:apolipoprotein N-acyltransferase